MYPFSVIQFHTLDFPQAQSQSHGNDGIADPDLGFEAMPLWDKSDCTGLCHCQLSRQAGANNL